MYDTHEIYSLEKVYTQKSLAHHVQYKNEIEDRTLSSKSNQKDTLRNIVGSTL